MLRQTAICTALVFAAACYHGPSLLNFRPAYEPAGIEADLTLRETDVCGELLEVQDTALVVLTDSGKVVLAAVRDIMRGAFGQRGVLIERGHWLGELGSVSRFPAGMTPDVRARLLAAYGQTEFEIVR